MFGLFLLILMCAGGVLRKPPQRYPHECTNCWTCGGCWDCGTCTCYNIPTPEQEEKTPDDPDEE